MTFVRTVEIDDSVVLTNVALLSAIKGLLRCLDLVPDAQNQFIGLGANLIKFIMIFVDGLNHIAMSIVYIAELLQLNLHHSNRRIVDAIAKSTRFRR